MANLGRDERSWATLDQVVRRDINDQKTFEQRYEGSTGSGNVDRERDSSI